jgi:hypothetical protein
MKVYPEIEHDEKKEKLGRLTTQEKILRLVALLVAFLSVFGFFVKILFL